MKNALPQAAKPDPRKIARERRLALALRENLGKRKDQERQRQQGQADSDETVPASLEHCGR